MDFARQQRDPTRHVIGIVFVILVHVAVIYALMTGLARKAVEVIKKPLNATIIEEIKAPPPPPPPPKKVIEPPKAQPVQQPYVPPPDIPMPTPTQEPVISAPTTVVPTEPVVIAPPAVVAPPAPKPAIRQGVSCTKMEKPTFPREAIKAQVQRGRVDAILTIDEKGNVADVRITTSDPPRVFDRAVRDTLIDWKCAGDGTKYQASVEINFSLKDD
jgi:periplasmic protein TonB